MPEPPPQGELDDGTRAISLLDEVMPGSAPPPIEELYEDIRNTLRVPLVNFIFRFLGNFPEFLTAAWFRMRPILRGVQFESTANSLRRIAVLPGPRGERAQLAGMDGIDDARAFTDTIHYVLPKLLLIATALHEGLRPLSRLPVPQRRGLTGGDIPFGVAEGTAGFPMVDPKTAGGEARRVLESIARSHDHPDIPSYYRVAANWPWLLEPVWDCLAPLIGTDAYGKKKEELLSWAQHEVVTLWGAELASDWRTGLKPDEIAVVRGALAVFRFRVIPETFIEVAAAKVLLDGPEAALSCRFSAVAG